MSNLENHFCGAGVNSTEGGGEVVRSWNKTQEDLFAFRRKKTVLGSGGYPINIVGRFGSTWVGTSLDTGAIHGIAVSDDLLTWTERSRFYTGSTPGRKYACWDGGYVIGFDYGGSGYSSSTDGGFTWTHGATSNGSWYRAAKLRNGVAIFCAWQVSTHYALVENYGATVTLIHTRLELI